MRINIPKYAQSNAEKGLQGSGYGTDKGRYRARYLRDHETMSKGVAEEVLNFLKRFHAMANRDGYTENITGALNLWGGSEKRRFMKHISNELDGS